MNPATTNVPTEIGGVISTAYIRFESGGIVRNIPVSTCSNVIGTAPGTVIASPAARALNWYRSPNSLEWDGTNPSSKISLVNGPTMATTANQDFTIVVDGWFAPKTEATLGAMFYPHCADDDPANILLEKIINARRLLTAVRTGMGKAAGLTM